MRILSVATFAHPEHFGGAERVISSVAQGLAARGHELTLLTALIGDSAPEEERDGVRIRRYPVRRDSPIAFYRSVWSGVRAALRSGVGADAQLTHLHQTLSAVAATAPGSPLRCPRLFSFYAPYDQEFLAHHRHGHASGNAPLGKRLVAGALRQADRYLLRKAHEIVVLSEFSRAQIAALDEAAAGRATIAAAGVDLLRFRPAIDADEARACRAALGLEEGPPWVISVRRLVPRMGLLDLIDAGAALAREGLDFRIAVAGVGEQLDALRARAEDSGLGDRVRFLGRVPDEQLGELYRAASVFVLPTRSLEGFGMATAEALATGLPVVATTAGATAEVLEPVPGARLVPPADPAALASALRDLLSDPQARREAGRASRECAERLYTWDRHLDALEASAERLAGAAN